MTPTATASAYIIAARRTALGRVGGLHKARRLEDLAAPVVAAALADAKVTPGEVDGVVIGNALAGGNPARLIALTAGLPETVPALTIDRQCGSGLDAILTAIREIAAGDADVMIAGGADSISTAPWRIARPRSLYQTPHFINFEAAAAVGMDTQPRDASDALARRLKISRQAQDAFALKQYLRAEAAREARRFVGEIVPLRANADEARDQIADIASMDDLEDLSPFQPPAGTVTPGNSAHPYDGAAIVVIVSERRWTALGKPAALRLVASAAQGSSPQAEAQAPIAAVAKLYKKLNGFDRSGIGAIEMSETSAAQALALVKELGFDENILNADGGAIVRGHPAGAAGAVLVTRLFTQLARDGAGRRPHVRYGVAVQGTSDGLGVAALFEAIGASA
jgi:acetyl-CoA C-acetyltransferase